MNNGLAQVVATMADILDFISDIIRYIRQQNYSDALLNQKKLSESIITLEKYLAQDNEKFFLEMLTRLLSAQNNGDYVLYADLLELELMPYISSMQTKFLEDMEIEIDYELYNCNMQKLCKKNQSLCEIVEKEHMDQVPNRMEYTTSGLLTCSVESKNGLYYMHSNNNPRQEAGIFARQYYSTEFDNYVVFGLGLGYHIEALLALDDGISIDIIEPNINIIHKALTYMDFTWLWEHERVQLFYDPDYVHMKECLSQAQVLAIHYPSMMCIDNYDMHMFLQKFFIRDSGIRKYNNLFKNNFRDNILLCDGYVDELRERFKDKNAVLVAAGPSLDKNIELLRNVPDNTLIIAVGTVYHKLMSINIHPDYVVFLDAQSRNKGQIEGLEKSKIPLLIASTASKEIGMNYHGKKYLVCQRGYDNAEKYAADKGYQLYETGGSVSTIALDICIRLGCREMAYVGLDLAYTNGQSHAGSTMDHHIVDKVEEAVEVQAINGEFIKANRQFVIYREWMEKRALQEDAAGKLIDATEGGAYIKNWRIQTLKNVFAEWNNLKDVDA